MMKMMKKITILSATLALVSIAAGLSTGLAQDKTQKAADALPAVPDLALGENHPAFLKGIPGKGSLWATFETSKGAIQCQLHEDKTPQTVLNFVGLGRGLKAFKDADTGLPVKRPFYDGIKFHRVIPNFMIQVGDPKTQGTYNPGYAFEDEIDQSLTHDKPGVLSMANAGPKTNGSQIFITEAATPWLDGKHTIFGQCQNLDVIKAIANVPRAPGDKPIEPIAIKSLRFERRP